ncbi:MAG: hypothetical protein JXR37_31810 [Kiritimatiellae bacterium]|nr:hypothetical protein [Kiritimatiellia bacterium]
MQTALANRHSARRPVPIGQIAKWKHQGIRLHQALFRGQNARPVLMHVTEIDAERTRLDASVSPDLNPCGIVRGLQGDPVYIRRDGARISDPRAIRCDCLSFTEHLERVFARHRRPVSAAVSFGDVIMNNECVVAIRADALGFQVHCRDTERPKLEAGHEYVALGVQQDDAAWAGRVRFRRLGSADRYDVTLVDGVSAPRTPLRLVVTGPPVVVGGRPLQAEESAARWSDLRHLVCLLSCRLPTGATMLLGEALLSTNPELLVKAVRGEPIEIPLTYETDNGPAPLPLASVESILNDAQARGYTLMKSALDVRRRGEFAVPGDRMLVRFLAARYPHSLLGLDWERKNWVNLQIEGVSTRSGSTVTEAGLLMHHYGAEWAIGLDEGADPQLAVRTNQHFYYKASFNYRARIAASLVWTRRAGQPRG